jgi:protein-disulfide isomerase
MRIFDKEKKEGGDQNLTVSLLVAGLPMMLIVGLFIGYQLWGQDQPDPSAQPQAQPQQQGAADPTRRVEVPIDEYDPVRGPADAKVTMVEFTDYQCPYCQRYYNETYERIIEEYGDQIRYVLKDLPLISIHPEAVPASIAAHCANEQDSFWEYHGQLFIQEFGLNDQAYQSYAQNLQLNMSTFNDCLDSGRYDQAVMADIEILTAVGAPLSTPTFFINGRYIAGAQPFENFAQIIEAELAAAE